ncbi:MAG: hypothetical protein U9P68_09810 [Pseudomonadota bacterium]|nr:hypothetical protein [Pseudomonadota bacterium]
MANGPDITGWRLAEYEYDAQGRLEAYITRRGPGGTQFSRMDLTYEPDSDLETLSHDFYSTIPENVGNGDTHLFLRQPSLRRTSF